MFPHLRPSPRLHIAGEARSILACPRSASLQINGIEDPVADDDLSLLDDSGVPALLSTVGSPLDVAASSDSTALLTLTSGLSLTSSEHDELLLAGRLVRHHTCAQGQVVVTLDIDTVLLRSTDHDSIELSPAEFRRPDLRLNRGYLQASACHANRSHQAELRQAVARAAGVRLNSIAGVHLDQLSPTGVRIGWVDTFGSHVIQVDFDRPARSPEDLGTLLSEHLHAQIC